MDDTLRALGEILLRAVPTFLLVVLLHIYLKKIFFQPMEKVLHQRFEATEGARKLAEQSLSRATARTAEYEAAMRAARSEVYQAQEQLYRQLQESQAAQLAAARQTAEAGVRQAKAQLARDTEEARLSLARSSDALAGEIADSILEIRGNAA
jgi:F-type H+-transporting ATPase subunit b